MLVIGHRGAPRRARENTIDAFRAAAALGADGVELDVHVTADGEPVVHHDPVLPDGRALAGLALGELPPWLPTLRAALACAGELGLWVDVEIKSDPTGLGFDPTYAAVGPIAEVLGEHDPSRLVVSSFDPACLGALRAVAPRSSTAQLVSEVRAGTVDWVARNGHAAIVPPHRLVDRALVDRAAGAGLSVYPWTVDDEAEMRRLAALGVAGIITDVPEVLRAVLS